MSDNLFDYLVATDTLDEFLGYKGLDKDEDDIEDNSDENNDESDDNKNED